MSDKPKLEKLQLLANHYFEKNPPVVKWKKLESIMGMADYVKNEILLDTKIPLDCEVCKVGTSYFSLKENGIELKLVEGEQYYFVLLHEVGHFKFKYTPPKSYIKLKKLLEKEYPSDLETQYYETETYIRQRRNESLENWRNRVDCFKGYLDGTNEHMGVEMWAVKEFRKWRKKL